MDKLTQLKQDRAAVIKKQRQLIDKAEEEDRGLNSDEQKKFDRMDKEIDQLEDRIEKIQKVREREKREIKKEIQTEKKQTQEQGDEYRAVFERYLRKGFESMDRGESQLIREKRAQNVANSAKGGYLVPQAWANQIIEELREQSIMRRLATVETTAIETNIPVSTSKPEFGWIDEEGTYPETDEEYGQKSVDAWKNGGIIKVSEELLYDNQYNLEARIERDFSLAAGEKEEEAFINGNGVKKPRGIILDAEAGVSDAGGSANVDFDDVIDLKYSLKSSYRRNAAFLANDDFAKTIRKLKDDNNRYLWEPSTQAGQPDSLLGYSIYYSPEMPKVEDNEKALLFGDFSYYVIYDRQGLFMQRLEEKYAETGQIGFRAYMRTDGLLTLPEAVKYLDVNQA